MKPPAFQFYADDFVAGTSILTTEEVGAYILLLCYQWNCGHVPNNDDLIRRIAKITQAFPLGLLKSKFEEVDGVLKNRRLESERDKQTRFRDKQAKNGANGGRPKNPGLTQALAKPNPNKSSPSPSPSPSPIVEREREGSWNLPEIPPMSRKDFNTLAEMRGVPQDCAEWFWNTNDARNWIDSHGQLIRKVEPLLLNALKSWRANQKPKPQEQSASFQPALGGAEMILRSNELKRVEDKIREIKSSYESHQDMSAQDKAQIRTLRTRAGELKKMLGMLV